MIRRTAWFALLISTAAIGQKADLVRVVALADGRNCKVFEQQLACDAVGAYLRDTRHVPAGHSVVVEPVGGQPSIRGVLEAGHSIEAAGYSGVYKVAFITAPSSDSKP